MLRIPKQTYKILIIEDDFGLNKLVKRKLERTGFTCLQAHSGLEALEIIRAETSRLILLMDYLLSDMNSIELILTLRDEEFDFPFIAMTGQGSEDIAVDLMKLGAKDYLVKNEEFINILPTIVNQVIENLSKDEQLRIAEEKINFLGSITKQTTDAIIASDLNFNITYANLAATTLYDYPEEQLMLMNIQRLMASNFLEENKIKMLDAKTINDFWVYEGEQRKRTLLEFFAHIKISPLFTNDNLDSFIFIIRDVTERKERETEREKLITDLQEAIKRIKTLEGLIPICARCKKIRNDDGYWEEVEIHICNHTKADFTHGLCPTCTKEMYPDIYKKLKEQGKI